MDRYRHKKRGTTYEVLTDGASLQFSSMPDLERDFEDECFTVYRSEDTGAYYVRPTDEFMDGRFEKLE